jgi:hypothetical protein
MDQDNPTVAGQARPNGALANNRAGDRRIRSAVTNGTRAYVVGDGNSPWARRQRDLVAMHAEDAGGVESLSAAQLSLCQRAATLETELELLEGQLSLGKQIDLDCYGRLAGHLRRILETIGAGRVARDVTPDVNQVVAEILAREASEMARKAAGAPKSDQHIRIEKR